MTMKIPASVALVVTSYRQTIFAYPGGGGSYLVSRDNLGRYPSLVAGLGMIVATIMLALPFGLQRQVRGPGQAVAREVLLDDGFQFELIFVDPLAGHLADPRPAGLGVNGEAETVVLG